MNKPRYYKPTSKLPPRPDQPELPYMEPEAWEAACSNIVDNIAVQVEMAYPHGSQPPKLGRGRRKKDQRAHLAAALVQWEYETWTGQGIGRPDGGPFKRVLQVVLDKIDSDMKANSLISALRQNGTRKRRKK